MSGRILVLNAGSSSLKFGVYALGSDRAPRLQLNGAVTRLPHQPHLRITDASGAVLADEAWASADGSVEAALTRLLRLFADSGEAPDAVGHRIVHGGLAFRAPDRTLTEEEASEARLKAAELAKERFGAEMRG